VPLPEELKEKAPEPKDGEEPAGPRNARVSPGVTSGSDRRGIVGPERRWRAIAPRLRVGRRAGDRRGRAGRRPSWATSGPGATPTWSRPDGAALAGGVAAVVAVALAEVAIAAAPIWPRRGGRGRRPGAHGCRGPRRSRRRDRRGLPSPASGPPPRPFWTSARVSPRPPPPARRRPLGPSSPATDPPASRPPLRSRHPLGVAVPPVSAGLLQLRTSLRVPRPTACFGATWIACCDPGTRHAAMRGGLLVLW